MPRHYSSKDFFRLMPNSLLARYFHQRGQFLELDFGAMKEARPDALFEAWIALPDQLRNPMEADFRDILDMSDAKGFRAISDEAAWHLEDDAQALAAFMAALAALEDHGARAMTAFLDHNECWKGATRFHHSDRLGTHWRKRKNLPQVPAKTDMATLARLAELIKGYFRKTEGRAKNCVVEAYRRADKDYFFAFPEDHAQRSIEWVDGQFDPRAHNPAFEIIFVYTQANGTLDVNFRGGQKVMAALQGMFADAILGLSELPPDPKDNRVYDLDALIQPTFTFTHPVGSGVGTVVVKKMRLSSQVRLGDRITLEADTTSNRQAVYELVEQVRKALPLDQYNVTQVELSATVWVDAGKPPKTVTFRVGHPNSCSLKYDELDLTLRQMLEASGIEPKAPPAAAAAAAAAVAAPATSAPVAAAAPVA